MGCFLHSSISCAVPSVQVRNNPFLQLKAHVLIREIASLLRDLNLTARLAMLSTVELVSITCSSSSLASFHRPWSLYVTARLTISITNIRVGPQCNSAR